MAHMYRIVKHYRDDPALRSSFNALAGKTFGLNFEGWYQNGFWGDDYDPYSVIVDGRIVANVSVNRTDMVFGGKRRRLIQLGTVMTEESFRNRGMIRAIMAEIDRDFPDVDGVYLFGSDSVVDFYPKFGFRKGREYLYTRAVRQDGAREAERMPMKTGADWARLQEAMDASTFRGACDMVDNDGLIFFYVSQFLQDCVYYIGSLDTWVIAEQEADTLLLHNVFADKEVSLDAVIRAFGGGIRQVTLGFAPAEAAGFERREHHGEDCTFFVKGKCFGEFEERCLRIPSLSHA